MNATMSQPVWSHATLAQQSEGFWDFPLFPEQASNFADAVDSLYIGLVSMSAVLTLLIFFFLTYFAIRYRAGSRVSRLHPITRTTYHEVVWLTVPLAIALVLFTWAAQVFVSMKRPPADTLDIYVVGKQWMWKLQHPGGQREINTLHVPLGQPVRLMMTSQDVIHSFFIPAFRVKQDVLPGRTTTMWFTPTRAGEFHLFCAEYCGTDHSRMVGRVVVLPPQEYQSWLAMGGQGETMAEAGLTPFMTLGCNTCHVPDSDLRAPQLAGLMGRQVQLAGGGTVLADEEYIRASILEPQEKIVAGYPPVMPSYRGQVSAEELHQLIEYIRTLQAPAVEGAEQ